MSSKLFQVVDVIIFQNSDYSDLKKVELEKVSMQFVGNKICYACDLISAVPKCFAIIFVIFFFHSEVLAGALASNSTVPFNANRLKNSVLFGTTNRVQ